MNGITSFLYEYIFEIIFVILFGWNVECMDIALSNLHVGQLLLGFQHNLEQY